MLSFFDMLGRFQHMRYLSVNSFRNARTFFTDGSLGHFRNSRIVYLHDSAFTEQGMVDFYFFDQKSHVEDQVFGLSWDVSERFVVNFAKVGRHRFPYSASNVKKKFLYKLASI